MSKIKLTEIKKTCYKNDENYIKTIVAHLNPKDNGGEAVIVEVDFLKDQRDNAVYTGISIESHCYGVSSSSQSFYGIDLQSFIDAFNEIDKIRHLLEIERTTQ